MTVAVQRSRKGCGAYPLLGSSLPIGGGCIVKLYILCYLVEFARSGNIIHKLEKLLCGFNNVRVVFTSRAARVVDRGNARPYFICNTLIKS